MKKYAYKILMPEQYDGQPQGAHRIGNTKANRAKYGDMVIDNPLNIGYTCSLKCNGALDISGNPAECIKLCNAIYTRAGRKDGKRIYFGKNGGD